MESSVLQSTTLFVPDNFDEVDILSGEPGNSTLKRSLTDAMYYVLDTIIKMEHRRDMKDQYLETGYYRLNATHLKKICGTHYSEAIRILEKNQIIAVNRSYQVGKKSMGYCLINDSVGANVRPVKLSLEGKAALRLENYLKEQQSQNLIQLSKISFITKWFDKKRLTIDLTDAHTFVEFYRNQMLSYIVEDENPIRRENIKNRINQRYNAAIATNRRIAAGDFNLTRLGEDHRLHSSVSNLMKEFRSFLRYDREPLIGIDVKASQPYLFTQLLKAETYQESNKDLTIPHLYPELHKALQVITDKGFLNRAILMLLTFPDLTVDQYTFANIDWTNDFYQTFMNLSAINTENGATFANRSSVKKTIMLTLYASQKWKYTTTGWEAFRSLFPRESALVNLFDELTRSQQINFLPILLQRIESYLMLEMTCSVIAEVVPDAPIIPIHDSILTTGPYVERVEAIIKKTLTEITGHAPGLTIESNIATEVLLRLEETAKMDFQEIMDGLPKKADGFIVHRRKPLLNELPEWKNKRILSTIYINPE